MGLRAAWAMHRPLFPRVNRRAMPKRPSWFEFLIALSRHGLQFMAWRAVQPSARALGRFFLCSSKQAATLTAATIMSRPNAQIHGLTRWLSLGCSTLESGDNPTGVQPDIGHAASSFV